MEKERWMEAVEDLIHGTYEGWYVDIEDSTEEFKTKISRFFDRHLSPAKAAPIILRYVLFMDYVFQHRLTMESTRLKTAA